MLKSWTHWLKNKQTSEQTSQSQKNLSKRKGHLLCRSSKIWPPFALLLVLSYYCMTGLSSMIAALSGLVHHYSFFFSPVNLLWGLYQMLLPAYLCQWGKEVWQQNCIHRSTSWASDGDFYCYSLIHSFMMFSLYGSKACLCWYNTGSTLLASLFFYWLSALSAYLGSKSSTPSQKNSSCNFLEALFGQSMNGPKRQ